MHIQAHKVAHKSRFALVMALAIFAGMTTVRASAQDNAGPDPADVNMAPVDGSQQPAAVPQNESQRRATEYAQTGAQAGAPTDQSYANGPDNQQYDPNEDAVDAGQAALEEDASAPPPPLPVYEQPEAPAPNYLWTPGYWSYAPVGYYWVPGAWCAPPYYGALWTPGYWYFYGNRYRFHPGFWGLHIGFYGGINYGFGYTGYGYYGGYWSGNNFYYNRAVNRINVSRITYVYNRTVVVNNYNRVSYNGGRGGLQVRPRPAELATMRASRTPPMATQIQFRQSAAQNRQQFFNQNKGRPAIVAAPRPISADRGVQRPQPRPSQQYRPNQPQLRPNQPQQRPGPPQTQPNQPQVRPDRPQYRPDQPQVRPDQPQTRPNQPQVRPDQPQVNPDRSHMRPNQPQTMPAPQQQRPNQPRPESTQRPMQQQRAQPQPRQSQESKPASRPEKRQEDNHFR